VVPSDLAQSGGAFGSAPDRWFIEPAPNALADYSMYRLAFAGCLTFTAADMRYATAPTTSSAASECQNLQHLFWSRTPVQDEIDACSAIALNDPLPRRMRHAAGPMSVPRS
jgi:hypothetical protein